MSRLSKSALRLCLALKVGLLSSAITAQTRIVTDPDSVLSLSIPKEWQLTDLGSQDASLQMADPEGSMGLLVITELKDDFFGWNMTRFLHVTLGQGVGALDFPEVNEVEHVSLDGAPAFLAVVTGAIGGQQVVYLRTGIDAPQHWVQVILFGVRSAWASHESVLREIVASVDLFHD